MEFETREAIREAVLDGRVSTEDATAMWSAEDPHHAIAQQAGAILAELADDDADGM